MLVEILLVDFRFLMSLVVIARLIEDCLRPSLNFMSEA